MEETSVIEETLKLGWQKLFQTANLESVSISGMIKRDDSLIIVGSTGAAPRRDDMNGIMAKVPIEDGSFVTDGTNRGDDRLTRDGGVVVFRC